MKKLLGLSVIWLLVLVLASCTHIAALGQEMPLGNAPPEQEQAQQPATSWVPSTPLPRVVTWTPSTPLPPVATSIPSTPLPPAKTQVPETPVTPVGERGDYARWVVEAFFETVSTGDVGAAMSYWHLARPDQSEGYADGMRRLVREWATGEHEFTVGGATYGGLVVPQDYRQLDEDDPRVQKALVTVTIDGRESAFELERIDTAWWICGWMPPGTPLTPVEGHSPGPGLVYTKGGGVFRVDASSEQRTGTLPEDAGHLALGHLGLAYVSDSRIQVLHPYDGTTHTWFAFPERAGQDFDLHWSDDGLALAYAVAWDEPDGSRKVELGVFNGAQRTVVDTRVARPAGPTPTPPSMPPLSPMPGFAILDIVGFDRLDGHLAVTPVGGQDRYSVVWFYDLSTMKLDGETPVNVEIYEMALSPDQTRLAVVRPGILQIWPLGTDAPPMQAELPANTHAAGLHWSPDGQQLAYLVNEGPAPGLDAGLTQSLWVWKEGHSRQVVPVAEQAVMHGWTSDSREAVLEVLEPANAQTVIRLVDVENGESRPVAVLEMARVVGWFAD